MALTRLGPVDPAVKSVICRTRAHRTPTAAALAIVSLAPGIQPSGRGIGGRRLPSGTNRVATPTMTETSSPAAVRSRSGWDGHARLRLRRVQPWPGPGPYQANRHTLFIGDSPTRKRDTRRSDSSSTVRYAAAEPSGTPLRGYPDSALMNARIRHPPRVRFAPSPTGYLHVGGARTALFNWLLRPARPAACSCCASRTPTWSARRPTWSPASSTACAGWASTGTRARASAGRTRPTSSRSGSSATATAAARAGERAATPTTTSAAPSRRGDRAGRGRRLLRTRLRPRGLRWLSRRTRWLAAWRPASRTPSASWCRPARPRFADLVHGPVRFDRAHIEDFVVLRSDGHPTYHLSVVVDDIDMAITPRDPRRRSHLEHAQAGAALRGVRAPVPAFAHVPLIMGPDKKRLSKRHGATSVMEYERQGYLPEALVNFLALLGWSPGGDDELLSKDELVDALRARRHQHRQRRLQHREARLVQPPVSRPALRRRAGGHAAAVVRARRPVARRPRRRAAGVVHRRADAAQAALQAARRVRGRRPAVPRGAGHLRPRRAPPSTCRRLGCAATSRRLRGAYRASWTRSTTPSSSGRSAWWPTRAA